MSPATPTWKCRPPRTSGRSRHPAGVTVHWLPRDDHAAVPGQLALKTVTSSWKLRPDQRIYCWVAGESGLPTGLRRHLVKEQGVPKTDVSFLGYWRHGKRSPGLAGRSPSRVTPPSEPGQPSCPWLSDSASPPRSPRRC
ncbi:siderophore-interacting protein [Streptomyces canus]